MSTPWAKELKMRFSEEASGMESSGSLRIHRKSAPQNLSKRGSVGHGKFTEAVHNFILCQHRQLVSANRRGCIQAGLAPLVNRDIEVRGAETGGDGSGNKIVVARIKEYRGWT